MSNKSYILHVLLLSCCACFLGNTVFAGPTAKQAYISGESCYKALRNSPRKREGVWKRFSTFKSMALFTKWTMYIGNARSA